MLRRLRWMLAGAGLGLGGSWWARRTARRAMASLRPAQVGSRVARDARGRVRAARVDARSARRATEHRLRQRLAVAGAEPAARPPTGPTTGAEPAARPPTGPATGAAVGAAHERVPAPIGPSPGPASSTPVTPASSSPVA